MPHPRQGSQAGPEGGLWAEVLLFREGVEATEYHSFSTWLMSQGPRARSTCGRGRLRFVCAHRARHTHT